MCKVWEKTNIYYLQIPNVYLYINATASNHCAPTMNDPPLPPGSEHLQECLDKRRQKIKVPTSEPELLEQRKIRTGRYLVICLKMGFLKLIALIGLAPPEIVIKECTGTHGKDVTCHICKWNLCQACGAYFMKSFCGWTGNCGKAECQAKCKERIVNTAAEFAALEPVPDDSQGGTTAGLWETIPEAKRPKTDDPPPSVEIPAAKPEVVDLTGLEDPPIQPPPDFPRDWGERPVFEDNPDMTYSMRQSVELDLASPKAVAIEAAMREAILQGMRKFQQEKDDEVSSAANYIRPNLKETPLDFTVLSIREIQDLPKMRQYIGRLEEIRAKNAERDLAERFTGSGEETVYHGTTYDNAAIIERDGPDRVKSKDNVRCGKGFYVTPYPQLAFQHGWRSGPNNTRFVLILQMASGKTAETHFGDLTPPDGYDSGGSGWDLTEWMRVAYKDNQVWLRYVVEWEYNVPSA